jgi:hypothetical protein
LTRVVDVAFFARGCSFLIAGVPMPATTGVDRGRHMTVLQSNLSAASDDRAPESILWRSA